MVNEKCIRKRGYYYIYVENFYMKNNNLLNSKLLKKALMYIESICAIICLYYWIINDFENNLYIFFSKFIVICVLARLISFFINETIKHN